MGYYCEWYDVHGFFIPTYFDVQSCHDDGIYPERCEQRLWPDCCFDQQYGHSDGDSAEFDYHCEREQFLCGRGCDGELQYDGEHWYGECIHGPVIELFGEFYKPCEHRESWFYVFDGEYFGDVTSEHGGGQRLSDTGSFIESLVNGERQRQ